MFSADQLQCRHVGPISFVLKPGEALVIDGPSGSGKSLLLRGLADLEPSAGQIELYGQAMSSMPAMQWRQQVMYVPGDSGWWADSVGEHFTSFDRDLASTWGLAEDILDWPVARLSGGERQRLALLRALLQKPKVLMLDEATVNLDDAKVQSIETEILRRRDQDGLILLWVSHDSAQRDRVAKHKVSL